MSIGRPCCYSDRNPMGRHFLTIFGRSLSLPRSVEGVGTAAEDLLKRISELVGLGGPVVASCNQLSCRPGQA